MSETFSKNGTWVRIATVGIFLLLCGLIGRWAYRRFLAYDSRAPLAKIMQKIQNLSGEMQLVGDDAHKQYVEEVIDSIIQAQPEIEALDSESKRKLLLYIGDHSSDEVFKDLIKFVFDPSSKKELEVIDRSYYQAIKRISVELEYDLKLHSSEIAIVEDRTGVMQYGITYEVFINGAKMEFISGRANITHPGYVTPLSETDAKNASLISLRAIFPGVTDSELMPITPGDTFNKRTDYDRLNQSPPNLEPDQAPVVESSSNPEVHGKLSPRSQSVGDQGESFDTYVGEVIELVSKEGPNSQGNLKEILRKFNRDLGDIAYYLQEKGPRPSKELIDIHTMRSIVCLTSACKSECSGGVRELDLFILAAVQSYDSAREDLDIEPQELTAYMSLPIEHRVCALYRALYHYNKDICICIFNLLDSNSDREYMEAYKAGYAQMNRNVKEVMFRIIDRLKIKVDGYKMAGFHIMYSCYAPKDQGGQAMEIALMRDDEINDTENYLIGTIPSTSGTLGASYYQDCSLDKRDLEPIDNIWARQIVGEISLRSCLREITLYVYVQGIKIGIDLITKQMRPDHKMIMTYLRGLSTSLPDVNVASLEDILALIAFVGDLSMPPGFESWTINILCSRLNKNTYGASECWFANAKTVLTHYAETKHKIKLQAIELMFDNDGGMGECIRCFIRAGITPGSFDRACSIYKKLPQKECAQITELMHAFKMNVSSIGLLEGSVPPTSSKASSSAAVTKDMNV